MVVVVAVPAECGSAFGDDQRRDLVPARLVDVADGMRAALLTLPLGNGTAAEI